MFGRLWLAAGLLLTVGLLTAGSSAVAQEKKGEKNSKTEPAAVKTDSLVYAKTPQGELKLLVHYPPNWKAGDKRAAIVFFAEGGAWTENKIDLFKTQADYLAKRGMVAFRAQYRVKNTHKTTADKAVDDAMSAIRWVRENAGKLGVNPKKIAAAGGSSGGLLAMAAYTTPVKTPKSKVSHKPDLLVLYNPLITTFRLASSFENTNVAKRMSPARNLAGGLPPTVMFFGTNDPSLQADGYPLMMRAKQAKLPLDIYFATSQSHGFFNKENWRKATLKATDRFLVRNGYLKGEAIVKADKRYQLTHTSYGPSAGKQFPPGFEPGRGPGATSPPPGLNPNNPPRPGAPIGSPVPPGVNPKRPGVPPLPGAPLPPGADPKKPVVPPLPEAPLPPGADPKKPVVPPLPEAPLPPGADPKKPVVPPLPEAPLPPGADPNNPVAPPAPDGAPVPPASQPGQVLPPGFNPGQAAPPGFQPGGARPNTPPPGAPSRPARPKG